MTLREQWNDLKLKTDTIYKKQHSKGVELRDLIDFEMLFFALTASKQGLRRQP